MMLENPLGLLNGDPENQVRAEDVPSGLACNCFCPTPGCGARFEAVHCRPPRQSHFRHYKAADCGVSYESAVHRLAKTILHREKRLMLPYLDVQVSRSIVKVGTFSLKERIVERKTYQFERAEIEVRMDAKAEWRVPDVVLWKRDRDGIDRRLLVEIVVTHDVSEEKQKWIHERNLATIKVYLGWADQAITEDQLKQILISGRAPWGGNIVCWVHHPGREAIQREVDDYYLESLRDGTNCRGISLKNRGKQTPPAPIEADKGLDRVATENQSEGSYQQGKLF